MSFLLSFFATTKLASRARASLVKLGAEPSRAELLKNNFEPSRASIFRLVCISTPQPSFCFNLNFEFFDIFWPENRHLAFCYVAQVQAK